MIVVKEKLLLVWEFPFNVDNVITFPPFMKLNSFKMNLEEKYTCSLEQPFMTVLAKWLAT